MSYQLQFGEVLRYTDLLLRGTWLTTQLTIVATIVGLGVGVAGAVCRTSGVPLLRWVAGAYVELIRNTPFLVQLFFIFFGLPSLGLRLTENVAAYLAMIINLGAYSTEIVRAGIQAIPRGQIEAGLSLGMSRLEIFRYIIIRPALEKIYPALCSQFIIVMLGSSVVSQISAEELTFAANFIQSRNFRSFEVYLIATALYLALSCGFRWTFRRIGRRVFARQESGR